MRLLLGRLVRAWPLLIGSTALALTSAGCVQIHGGAIEVSWAIFAPGGRAITDCSCVDPEIVEMRLNLSSVDGAGTNPCGDRAECRFACGRKTGSTPFDVPPGRYAMWLSALGADGADLELAPGFRSTPPSTWPVVWGQPTELDALTVEAPCASACNGQSMTQPCARP